jgi:hypothetical protein
MPTTLPAPNPSRRKFLSSELSRNSRSVMDAAEAEPVDIDRRDGHPLVLMSQQEADAKDALLQLAAQLIAVTVDDDKGTLGQRLSERFNWMFAFSEEMRERCAQDIIRAARASFSTGQAHLAVAELAAWESTAQAIAAGLNSEPLEWIEDSAPLERP